MSSWTDDLQRRFGPLVNAASKFAVTQGVESDPPRGMTGWRTLARALDRFTLQVLDVDGPDDRAFIEGAGAYLAVLMIDQSPNAHHVMRDGSHRVRLHDDVDFDPFAAISRVLDSEEPRRALVAELSRVEDETRGAGPVSRVVRSFRRHVKAERPDLSITERFDATVWMQGPHGSIEVDLAPVIRATMSASESSVESAITRLLLALNSDPNGADTSWAEAQTRLLPRLVGDAFMQKLGTHAARVYTETMQPGLRVAYTLQFEGRARYVRVKEVSLWRLDATRLLQTALDNLAGKSDRVRIQPSSTAKWPLLSARSGDGLDATRLLLPEFRQSLAQTLGSPFVVGVPHRDVLLACAVEDAEGIRELRARTREDYLRAPHPISDQAWVVCATDELTFMEALR